MSKTPDFIYDPDNWEVTYAWVDRSTLAEDQDIYVGKAYHFRTLVHGPDKWAVRVVLSRDDDGAPDETEIQWFDTKAEAFAAVARASLARGLSHD